MQILESLKTQIDYEQYKEINNKMSMKEIRELTDKIKPVGEYNKDDFKFFRYKNFNIDYQKKFEIVQKWYNEQSEDLNFFQLVFDIYNTFRGQKIEFKYLSSKSKIKKASFQIKDQIRMTYFHQKGVQGNIQNLMAFVMLHKYEVDFLDITGILHHNAQCIKVFKKKIQETSKDKLQEINKIFQKLQKKQLDQNFNFEEELEVKDNYKVQEITDIKIYSKQLLSQYMHSGQSFSKLIPDLIGQKVSIKTTYKKEQITVLFKVKNLNLKYSITFQKQHQIFMEAFWLLFTLKAFPKLFKKLQFAFMSISNTQKQIQFKFDTELLVEEYFKNWNYQYLIRAQVDTSQLINPCFNNDNLILQIKDLFEKDKKQFILQFQLLQDNIYQIQFKVNHFVGQQYIQQIIIYDTECDDIQIGLNFCVMLIIKKHFPENIKQIFLRYTFTQNLDIFEKYIHRNLYPQTQFKIIKQVKEPSLFDYFSQSFDQIQILELQQNFFDFKFFVAIMSKIKVYVTTSPEKDQFQTQ